ncbi:hypothetical protein LP421_33420 (plasmid) [Rhizobium sp. RCAM05350]|nr:hypothetical protein LP421_33420 [Rhizobium sp. RCAM05350]
MVWKVSAVTTPMPGTVINRLVVSSAGPSVGSVVQPIKLSTDMAMHGEQW